MYLFVSLEFFFMNESIKVPSWNTYYPSLENVDNEIKEFYYYFVQNVETLKYIYVWENLSYIFCYVYSVIEDFLLNNKIEILEQKLTNIKELYSHTKVIDYINNWLSDSYIYIWDYKNAWSYKKQWFINLEDVIFFNSVLWDIHLNWDLFIKIFWKQSITKFWKENIEFITKFVDLFLNDFHFEHNTNFIDYFFRDFKNINSLDSEIWINKYEKFFDTSIEFEQAKNIDIRLSQNYNNKCPYFHFSKKGLFHWIIMSITESSTTNFEFWTITFSCPKTFSNDILVIYPWEIIKQALVNYAKKIIRESENSYREESWIPKIWEWWVSETDLYYKIKNNFSFIDVIHHWRPEWLWRQHLDIFIPKYNIWIEYQWQQHLKPVDYFWWEEAFKKQKRRDNLKLKKCKKNNCNLIYVYEGYEIEEVNHKITSIILLKTIIFYILFCYNK